MGAPAAHSSPPATAATSNHREKSASSTPLLFATVALISVLPYLPALKFGFVYDDDVQVVQNRLLQSWRSLGAIFEQPSWSFLYSGLHGGYYRPVFLAWLSFLHHLFGLRPEGWHFSSLLLHGFVSGLLFLLLRRHAFAPWIAIVAALLFGLHPVHVESVAWVSGSTDLLAAASLLASLLLWWKSTEDTPRARWMLPFSLFFYMVALLAKETAIIFPGIVFVYVYSHRGVSLAANNSKSQELPALRKALPFLAVAVIYLGLRHVVLNGSVTTFTMAGLRMTIATAPALLLFYLRHLIWPIGLSLFYSFVPNAFVTSSSFLLPFLVLVLLAGTAGWLVPRFRSFRAVTGFSWLLFPLLPVLWVPFFPAGDQAHDRYLYLPSVGLAILGAELLRFAAQQVPRSSILKSSVGVVLLLLTASTVIESRPWRNDVSLYRHACRVSRDHPIACNNLAVALIGQGEYGEARDILRPLLQTHRDSSRINGNFGIANYRLADFATAESALRRATELDPAYADAFLYLALTCYRTNRLQEAELLLRQAVSLDPAAEGYHLALGSVLMAQNKYQEACEQLREELRQRPGLGAALGLLRDCEGRLAQRN